MSLEAMKLALKALNYHFGFDEQAEQPFVNEAIVALHKAIRLSEQPLQDNKIPCSTHPHAPHGFNRDASHSIGRYVCDCEGWTPDDMAYRPGGLSMDEE
jgi:hypothetical protein